MPKVEPVTVSVLIPGQTVPDGPTVVPPVGAPVHGPGGEKVYITPVPGHRVLELFAVLVLAVLAGVVTEI